jgi:hypothetical protein
MMPFSPMNDNIDQSLDNLAQGLPEEGAPAAQGGIGAVGADLGEGQEALKQEGALDEQAEEKSDKQ